MSTIREETVARLKGTKKMNEQWTAERGVANGQVWASKEATVKQLERLAEADEAGWVSLDDAKGPGYPIAATIIGDDEEFSDRADCLAFWLGRGGAGSEEEAYSEAYVLAFVAGALVTWREVRDAI